VELLSTFGRRLAVRDQLLNDLRDAAPDPQHTKADVRAGAHTVPLAFAGSHGAPAGLSEPATAKWEATERARIARQGGLAAALALAEAERLRIGQILGLLESLGQSVSGLRLLV